MQHAGRLKGWLLAVGWLAIPEHPHPFCPAVVDTSKAAVRQCFVWFLFFFNFWCTVDLGRETDFLLLFFIFIPPPPVGKHSTSPMLCFPFIFQITFFSPVFSCPGTEFHTYSQAAVPWPAMGAGGRERQEEVLLGERGKRSMKQAWGLLSPPLGREWWQNIMLVLYCYYCRNYGPRCVMRIKVCSKTALTWGPAKQNCDVFPLSLRTRVCCAPWMYLHWHQCRYTNRPWIRLQRLREEILYLMGCSPCKESTWFIKTPRARFACVLMLSCRNPNSCNLNPRCQSTISTVAFYRICIFLGGLLHAGGVDNHWRRLAGEGMKFPPWKKKAFKNRFSQQLAGWQSCRKSCLGAEGWIGWFPEGCCAGNCYPWAFQGRVLPL